MITTKLLDLIPVEIWDVFHEITLLTKDNPEIGAVMSFYIRGEYSLLGKTFTDCLLRGRIVKDSLFVTHLEYSDGDMLEECVFYTCEEDDNGK